MYLKRNTLIVVTGWYSVPTNVGVRVDWEQSVRQRRVLVYMHMYVCVCVCTRVCMLVCVSCVQTCRMERKPWSTTLLQGSIGEGTRLAGQGGMKSSPLGCVHAVQYAHVLRWVNACVCTCCVLSECLLHCVCMRFVFNGAHAHAQCWMRARWCEALLQ